MLIQKIDEDIKQAMKSKNDLKVQTLRMVKAALRNFLIEKQKEAPEENELITLIQKQIKLRQDAIEGFKRGGRQDLVDKETQEIKFLETYLPQAFSESEIEELVKKAIQQTGAKSKTDLGKVMKEALAQGQGRADGKRVNQTALRLLP